MNRLSIVTSLSAFFLSLQLGAQPVTNDNILGTYNMRIGEQEIAADATITPGHLALTLFPSTMLPPVECSGDWSLEGTTLRASFTCPGVDDVPFSPIASTDVVKLNIQLAGFSLEDVESDNGVSAPASAQFKESDAATDAQVWVHKVS